MSIVSTVASVATLASVVAFHEAGHLFAAKAQAMKVTSYNVGYGPKLLSFNDTAETEYALRLIPLGGYVAFPSNVEYNEEGEVVQELDDPDLLQNRPPLQRAAVISAGVIANILLTFLLSSGVAFTAGMSQPVFNDGVLVTSSPSPTTPAGIAGLQKNDLILKIDNDVIYGSEFAVEKFVVKIKQSENVPLPVEVSRQGKIVELTVTPRSNGVKATIGLGIANNMKEVVRVKAVNVFDAMLMGAEETGRIVRLNVQAVQRFFSSDFNVEAVGGPISVIKAGAEIGDLDALGLIGFAAALSVNLAVLNSLPIPALDGGQLVFVLAELVFGKLPRKAVQGVTAFGFSLMLALGLTTFLGDVSKLGGMLPPPNVVESNSRKE